MKSLAFWKASVSGIETEGLSVKKSSQAVKPMQRLPHKNKVAMLVLIIVQ